LKLVSKHGPGRVWHVWWHKNVPISHFSQQQKENNGTPVFTPRHC
jgi:hypothetical protein